MTSSDRATLEAPLVLTILTATLGGLVIVLILMLAPAYPGLLRPWGRPALLGALVCLVLSALVAAYRHQSSGRVADWWLWAALVGVALAGAGVADPRLQTCAVVALVVGAVHRAMYRPPAQLGPPVAVTAAVQIGFCLAVAATWPERAAALLGVLGVTGLILGGLIALRHRLDIARRRADQFSRRDALTGLLNRRGLLHRLPGLLHRAERDRHGLAMVLADIDHFKKVNDHYGHEAGDDVLKGVATALRGVAREGDVTVRLGGEELLILALVTPGDLPGLAERVLHEVASAPTVPAVTVSVGAAFIDPPARGRVLDPEAVFLDLFRRSDRLLYEAKRSGRNRALAESGTWTPAPGSEPVDRQHLRTPVGPEAKQRP